MNRYVYFSCFLLILLLSVISAGQTAPIDINEFNEYSDSELKGKYHKFTAFRNVGLSLLGVSAASLVSGIAMMSTSDIRTFEETQKAKEENPDTTFSDADDKKFIAGILMTIATIPLTSVGITFTAIGAKKRKEYRYKLGLRGLQANISTRKVSLELVADLY